MSDPHVDPAPVDHAHDDHEGHISDKTFLFVFVGLMIFTAVSFATNQILGAGAVVASFIIILGVAVCKALLVVAFFMHLKLDWRKLIVFIVPVCILAPLIVVVLWPDVVLAWRTLP